MRVGRSRSTVGPYQVTSAIDVGQRGGPNYQRDRRAHDDPLAAARSSPTHRAGAPRSFAARQMATTQAGIATL